jgi:hypothetical protein
MTDWINTIEEFALRQAAVNMLTDIHFAQLMTAWIQILQKSNSGSELNKTLIFRGTPKTSAVLNPILQVLFCISLPKTE